MKPDDPGHPVPIFSYDEDLDGYVSDGFIMQQEVYYVKEVGVPSGYFDSGQVLEVLKDKDRAIVEGINMVSKHTKPNAQHPQGGIIKQEAGIHISNLQVVDPVKGGPTRIGRRIGKNGKLVRYAKKSGEELK